MSGLVILGAGVTGLGAGFATGAPVFERAKQPGGICTSYYLGMDGVRQYTRREDGEDFRFEIGGGHWIFGGNPQIRSLFEEFTPFGAYQRRSAVYLPAHDALVPYPLQDHLESLPESLANRAREELRNLPDTNPETMSDWLRNSFGETLYDVFFEPFNALYTSGLLPEIAPQDRYKTPAVASNTEKTGYNAEFIYPENGLDGLFRGIASKCDVRHGMNVKTIDTGTRTVQFESGHTVEYDVLLSTLPLHSMLEMTGLKTREPDPHTSVLVLNIAAECAANCPDTHWVYVPESRGGFHRVGFYDHVDRRFLPASMRGNTDVTSMYVEKSYPASHTPTGEEIQQLIADVTVQLQEWGWIGNVLLADPTFIKTAYTWTRPGSDWKERSIALLEEHGIYQAGRFARWKFQGIAASFAEGMETGRRIMEDGRR